MWGHISSFSWILTAKWDNLTVAFNRKDVHRKDTCSPKTSLSFISAARCEWSISQFAPCLLKCDFKHIIFKLLVTNLLTVSSGRKSSLSAVTCNEAHQSWSVIILTDLRHPTSVTHLRDAKWSRIQNPPVVLRVNWSIKIPTALLQLKTALSVSDQPLSTSEATSTISWLNFKRLYLCCSTPGQNRWFCSSWWASYKQNNNQKSKLAISVSLVKVLLLMDSYGRTGSIFSSTALPVKGACMVPTPQRKRSQAQWVEQAT